MPYRPSSMYSSNNTSSLPHQPQQSSQQSALQARINAKKAELENLKQLRDLSAQLASQMSTLEQKLSTLRDGTEAVAVVLGNWDGVLGVIGMTGASVQRVVEDAEKRDDDVKADEDEDVKPHLPVTLVRIPVEDTKVINSG